VLFLFFFFSSRRRHTRWPRDWSSDVCSSDLVIVALCRTIFSPLPVVLAVVLKQAAVAETGLAAAFAAAFGLPPTQAAQLVSAVRSEERRVGKGGRSGRSPDV